MVELFFGDFRFDTRKLTLTGPDGAVELRAKTRELLMYLIEHRNRFVSRGELMDQVWAGVRVGDASLTQCISELRKTLGDTPQETRYIETRIKAGYRFVAPIFHKPTEVLELLPPPPAEEMPPSPSPIFPFRILAFAAGGIGLIALLAIFLWHNGPLPASSLLLAPTVREDGGELTTRLAEQLDRQLLHDLSTLAGLKIVPSGKVVPGGKAPSWALELRCRSVHGLLVEVTAVLRRSPEGSEMWGWTWSAPADPAQIEPLTQRITRDLRGRLEKESASGSLPDLQGPTLHALPPPRVRPWERSWGGSAEKIPPQSKISSVG